MNGVEILLCVLGLSLVMGTITGFVQIHFDKKKLLSSYQFKPEDNNGDFLVVSCDLKPVNKISDEDLFYERFCIIKEPLIKTGENFNHE